ncbi:anticodon-binding protein [Xylogone sp. PMI_703]|nr:anticodon-binding protein [Xylogone sp. PMI_703]
MGSKRAKPPSAKASLPFKTGNKHKRQLMHVAQKRSREALRRDIRFKRKREEERDDSLRRERLAKNIPHSIDKKRVWDEVDDDGLGVSVDVEELKRRRVEAEEEEQRKAEAEDEDEDPEDDVDSMLDSDSEPETEKPRKRASSIAASTTSTNLDLTPESLSLKFPTLFSNTPPPVPKILITTSLNSTLHDEAKTLCTLFPNATYIPRQAHRYGHKFSLREVAKYAAGREFSAIVLLSEDLKKPKGLSLVHLPAGPTFHFSITNWMEGKKLPGHGNPTNHYPELILNNFRTPLGLLTARMFLTLFPPQPELQGRQVVTLHNQRDYIFIRRHRYVFREKKETERSVIDEQGKPMEGVESIRAGMQELGPRLTLKLRRIDKYIGRAGPAAADRDRATESEGNAAEKSNDTVHWEWKAKMEKKRTRFNL